jgi:hypothetical protein
MLRNRQGGILKKETYTLIWRCLHPDSRRSVTDETLARAFHEFEVLKHYLLTATDAPAEISPLPSLAEWARMKAAADAERKAAKRAGKGA